MTASRLILRTAAYFWRTNLAVVLGVAAAVSVLSGALLVGDSVRGSLRDIALGRLGATESVLSSSGFFPEDLATRITQAAPGVKAVAIVSATAFITHEPSGRRAGGVLVYGVDDRFWAFHGLPAPGEVLVSPALARELSVQQGDVLLGRLQKPSQVPIESLFGRKEDVGRTVRLPVSDVLPRERLGEFALSPQQAEVRAIFAPLARIQRDLGVEHRANTILLAGGGAGGVERVARTALTLEDLDVRVTPANGAIAIETGSGILPDAVADAAGRVSGTLDLPQVPVFTYLANTLRLRDREVPYSLVTATDLSRLPGAPDVAPGSDSMVLNAWAARELGAARGDRIGLDYYLWDSAKGLTTHTATFSVAAVVPIEGLAADRRLAPEYPGITAADSLADWDPPFPIDLSRVRPEDEQYWETYRTTPKAFVEYERGRSLWQTRYGRVTSIRFPVPAGAGAPPLVAAVRRELLAAIPPGALGLAILPVRQDAIAGSAGATDFGEYFTYFSFFIVVSALLLAVLFFRLGIEQRLRQIGIMRAAGFTTSMVRRLLLVEALLLAVIGSLLGALGAIGYARLIVYGLETWWSGAVGTTLLELHVTWPSIAAGVVAGVVAAGACVWLSLRAVARLSPRMLMTVQSIETGATADPRKARRSRRIGLALAAIGLALLAAGFGGQIWNLETGGESLNSRSDPGAQAGLFFASGAALLGASMFLFAAWLRARDARAVAGRGTWAVAKLGFRSAAHRPARSVLSAALIAAAAFIIVSVDAFRRGVPDDSGDVRSGTGGFALLAESQLPLLHDPNDPAGREALVVSNDELGQARFTRFRVRQGEDASCLNLYRPTSPTIVAPEPAFIDSNRFSFAASLATTDEERRNPWLLLRRPTDDGTVPAIADATSLQYVLHLSVGDTMTIETGGGEPLRVRFVGALRDSVLQGELIVAEEQFVRLFPSEQGYRLFLVDSPGAADPSKLAGTIEKEFASFGIDAVTARERLAAFHRVENTYLSTFQALGGLGLLLGTIGLSAIMFRNVLERRRELALLRAVGFDRRRVGIVIMAEAILLLAAGLVAGTACAALAVAPAWTGRGGAAPGAGLVLLLAGVGAAGIVSSFIATRAALSGNLLDSLRAE